MPEVDKVVPLVARAGMAGMTRRQLGGAIRLEPEVLQDLLDGLVRFGMLVVRDEGGVQVYRTSAGLVGAVAATDAG